MTEPMANEAERPAAGVVERLACDDLGPKKFLKMAGKTMGAGACAYLGQAPSIQSKEILAAALSIHTIEARHAAAVNTLVKKSSTPEGAFAKPLSQAAVLNAASPLILK
jgi:hypothetical protein